MSDKYKNFLEAESEDNENVKGMLEFLKRIPDQYVDVLDIARYSEALRVIKKITEYVASLTSFYTAETYFDELTGTSLVFNISTDILSISDMQDFCKSLMIADTLEITPINGNLFSIGITFEKVKKVVG